MTTYVDAPDPLHRIIVLTVDLQDDGSKPRQEAAECKQS